MDDEYLPLYTQIWACVCCLNCNPMFYFPSFLSEAVFILAAGWIECSLWSVLNPVVPWRWPAYCLHMFRDHVALWLYRDFLKMVGLLNFDIKVILDSKIQRLGDVYNRWETLAKFWFVCRSMLPNVTVTLSRWAILPAILFVRLKWVTKLLAVTIAHVLWFTCNQLRQ